MDCVIVSNKTSVIWKSSSIKLIDQFISNVKIKKPRLF